jgi:hypothetical protein
VPVVLSEAERFLPGNDPLGRAAGRAPSLAGLAKTFGFRLAQTVNICMMGS